ncbi:MAG: ABC transporter permease, partial [Gemmatimonadetes bacterium]|nr:ABC transporter permease [Gemmatimonadota bacterium]
RVEGGLVVAEVGLAVIMAAGAALLVRSVANLQAIDPGVDTRGVAVLDVVVPPEETEAQRRQDFRTLAAELAKLPGVRSAGVAAKLPLRGPSNNWGIRIEGEPNRPPSTTFYRVVSPAYFRTMGIRILSGRGFVAGDAVIPDSLETPVVINRALARKYFPGQDPLGRRIGGGRGWARIVGVVDDVAEGDLEPSPGPARYVLFEHSPWVPSAVSLVVRVAQGWDETAILAQARRAIRRVAPGVAIQEATTMRQVFTHAVGPARQLLSLLGMLAGLALALGAVGVISHFVSRRKREWGIRMALGLPPRRILAQVVGRGGALVALGAVLGMLVSLGLARLLSTFLYGVRPADPLSLAAATGGLLLVGVVAALVPARRAATTDPAVVLRET